MKQLLSLLCTAIVALWATSAQAAELTTELIMVEEPGCTWCLKWDEELGEIYPKTPEGKYAPLRKVQMRDIKRNAEALNLTPARPVMFTPTFLLIQDGVELARLEGYPGEDFFWGLIEKMLIEHTGYSAP